MNSIHFSQNWQNFLIAYENGSSLCSKTDPQGEALRWVYSLGNIPTDHVVVIGLGAGFHVAALADIHPNIKITVVDNREALVSVFRSQFKDIEDRVEVVIASESRDLLRSDTYADITNRRCFVLSFCESWGEQDDLMSSFFAHATGRTVEAVKYHLSNLGMNMKSFYFESQNLVNMLEIIPAIEKSDLDQGSKQIFRALGELAHI